MNKILSEKKMINQFINSNNNKINKTIIKKFLEWINLNLKKFRFSRNSSQILNKNGAKRIIIMMLNHTI